MENVPAMSKGAHKQTYIKIVNHLRSYGYKVKGEILNSMYYNVPQSRERVFVIGVREDFNLEPSHPRPQNKPITARQALLGVAEDSEVRLITAPYLIEYLKKHPGGWSLDEKIYKKIKGNINGQPGTKFLEWSGVCGTLVKSEFSSLGVIHPSKTRYLSLSEYKRLSSFPDDFAFTSRAAGVQRIGNCVPPNMMKAIAIHIRDNILRKISQ
jgi:DNA (cytosine-5)-methyltransferase 1